MRLRAIALLLLLGGCMPAPGAALDAPTQAAGPIGEEAEAAGHRERLHWVAVGPAGATRLIQMRLCRPAAAAPAALVVINHGSPPNAANRGGMRPAACDSAAVTWFLARGYAVALPLRRGYGASGGAWAEAYGRCDAPDYRAAGLATAADIAAALDYARALPELSPARERVLLLGQSAGGWGVIALASRSPPGIAGVVNVAGGRGGWAGNMPNSNCAPDRLVAEAGRFGATARGVPMLWVYTANDSFFAPTLAAAMHAAFTGAGGQAKLQALAGFGRDGHGLFFSPAGPAVWGPVLAPYLAARGLPAEPLLPAGAAPLASARPDGT